MLCILNNTIKFKYFFFLFFIKIFFNKNSKRISNHIFSLGRNTGNGITKSNPSDS